MPSRKPAPRSEFQFEQQQVAWTISRLEGPVKPIGRVYACDKQEAIVKAVDQYQIDPAEIFRIVARRES
jgi:hypothetical protein